MASVGRLQRLLVGQIFQVEGGDIATRLVIQICQPLMIEIFHPSIPQLDFKQFG